MTEAVATKILQGDDEAETLLGLRISSLLLVRILWQLNDARDED
jgi:hypothetical protein